MAKSRTPNYSAISDSTQNYQASPSDEARIRMVTSRYDLAHKHQYPFWTDFDRYYKMYESYINDAKSIWQTKIFIPLVFSVVERYLPRIISNKPVVNFMPRLTSDDILDESGNVRKEDDMIAQAMARASKVQAHHDWQWDQVGRLKDGGMYLEQLRFVKEALITGTSLAKLPWRLESRETKVYNNKEEVENRLVKYFDGPDFELLDPYDVFFDPEAIDIQRASWIIHRTRKTLDEMYEVNKSKGVEIYKNLHILQSMTPDNLSATENDFKFRRKVALGGGQVLVLDDTTDKYELMECWGMFPKLDSNGEPTKDGTLEPRVIVLANRKVIVRDIPYPYWHGKKPFIKFTPFPRDFEFYGIPLIKHLERIQFYMNEFTSQRFDNQVINLNQMLVVDPQANLEDWQLVWRPGGVLRARPEFIKPLDVGDATSGIEQSLTYLNTVAQLTTGLDDYYTSGVNAEEQQNKTATGANQIAEQIAIRVQAAVQVYEEQVIKEIGYQWHGLNGQFVKVPQVVRTIGSDGKPKFPVVLPDDIRYEYDIIPEAGSTQPVNSQLEATRFISTIQTVQGNPVMSQNTDWVAVEKELWQKNGIKEGDKLMTQTPGSQPNQVPGGQALPGAQGQPQSAIPTGVNPMPQNMANALGQAANGQMPQAMPTPTQPPQGQVPGDVNPALKASMTVKFTDLTPSEQAQVLAQNNIKADLPTRHAQYAQNLQQAKHDRGMDMAERHINLMPEIPTPSVPQ